MSMYYEIDYKLYSQIKRIINDQQLFLFNDKKEFVEVEPKSMFKFILPIGLFSSESFPLPSKIFAEKKNYIINLDAITLPNLYSLQKKVVFKVLSLMREKRLQGRPMYITLHLSCGFGKTITACYLMLKHKRKTVICLPNKMLASQWKTVIESTKLSYIISLDGVKKLMDKLKFENVDVLIIINRHLSNEDFCKKIYSDYDTFILDESHMYNLMNNSILTRFLTFYPPKICYFLTATPRKYNRLYCNEIVNILKITDMVKTIKVVEYFFENYSSVSIRKMLKRKLDNDKYHIYTEKILSEDSPRNELILKTIFENFKNDIIKRTIVVTKLRSHMMLLYSELNKILGNELVFLGDAKNKSSYDVVKRIREKEKFIFVSTINYSGTGLDIPTLDSLILCNVVLNTIQVEQLFGRICRESDHQKRIVFLFPTTSIKEIRHLVGFFTQKIISFSMEKLGFEKAIEGNDRGKKELALCKALNLQTH
ncbi:putative DNA helicase transcriptional elongation factor [Lumpy skin disease virus]|uniref:DNA helicase transcriptional elongation factor n=1 Tax=Lumpy skin disease virus TaxID=59509 RepID=A0A1W6S9T2_LSDV|nr:putative DNA helicase transcriptional elongation factor [Lumpy skin disease virus NW-LW]ARO77418.1 putative DNA helicase transcriptional elongation factor [Lumpy skin disease virus]ART89436.1 putative DNA helicase transcriptional elongation factor [Lumpy skin disease virus]ATG80297.1 putative DNA helicase transcriptional elongation factor [Lumpy skin disease virus]AZC86107.1 putative DNA helicase transcriptional elongation factor [Lumpy skin disease virus]